MFRLEARQFIERSPFGAGGVRTSPRATILGVRTGRGANCGGPSLAMSLLIRASSSNLTQALEDIMQEDPKVPFFGHNIGCGCNSMCSDSSLISDSVAHDTGAAIRRSLATLSLILSASAHSDIVAH